MDSKNFLLFLPAFCTGLLVGCQGSSSTPRRVYMIESGMKRIAVLGSARIFLLFITCLFPTKAVFENWNFVEFLGQIIRGWPVRIDRECKRCY
ncbi:hypothetical protein C8R41DRAFT_628270 [Lentinula lateritia]|uniref:Uncharacterized protein n=1 Tax=Lentinula lateritia TaxID=40482 RepID=A0ABQ8V1I1_9AGAR|nr:hypothetical protein C8R41DRAFT_628270 [Lentinula lateritia]